MPGRRPMCDNGLFVRGSLIVYNRLPAEGGEEEEMEHLNVRSRDSQWAKRAKKPIYKIAAK